ncbi:MAG: hypothetical protein LC689_08700 [Myxococcales bacterium]|nr:hypothetical protein [Myxococcales bacterium]
MRGLGTAVVALADLLQVPLLLHFEDLREGAELCDSNAEQIIEGMDQIQQVKQKVIDKLDAAKKAKKKWIQFTIDELVPKAVRDQLKKYAGKLLDALLKLPPININPETCEVETSLSVDQEVEIEASAWGIPGVDKITVKLKGILKLKLDCDEMRKCVVDVDIVDGIEISGLGGLLSGLKIDTKHGRLRLKSLIEIAVFDLADELKKLRKWIELLKIDRDKIVDPAKKKEKQEIIDKLEKDLEKLEKGKKNLEIFPKWV